MASLKDATSPAHPWFAGRPSGRRGVSTLGEVRWNVAGRARQAEKSNADSEEAGGTPGDGGYQRFLREAQLRGSTGRAG
jgi:hypothetical protein